MIAKIKYLVLGEWTEIEVEVKGMIEKVEYENPACTLEVFVVDYIKAESGLV